MRTRRRGFTLIEVMIVVAIMGMLAVLAIPAFTGYLARSKTSEAAQNINQMFKLVSVYYLREISGQTIGSGVSGHCTVDDAAAVPATPTREKQRFDATGNAEFRTLGFTVADYVYFSYGISSVGGSCGNGGNEDLYTVYANGDLDADGTMSTFELVVASNGSNEIYHARGLYILNDAE